MTKHSKNNKNKKQRGGQQIDGPAVQPVAPAPTTAPTPSSETWYSKIMGSSPTSEKKQPGISNLFGIFGGKKSRRAKKSKRTNKSKTQRRH
jgi:hypothetical protein